MNEERAEELIRKCLDNMSDADKIDLYNNYCENNRYFEDKIYPMGELENYIGDLSQYTLGDLFGRFQKGDFNYADDFFRDTIYGIESTEYLSCWIDKDALVDYILFHEDCLGNKEIAEALLEAQEDEEEEAEE